MTGQNKLVPGNCCGCTAIELTVDDWDSGGDAMARLINGKVDLAGNFSAGRTVQSEAYAITVYDFTGTFQFNLDDVSYTVTESCGTVTITAGGTTREMVRDVIGDTSLPLALQLRVTPTHAYLIATETATEPSPTAGQLALTDGQLYTIATTDLAGRPSPQWSLTATGTYGRLWLHSSDVRFADDAQPDDAPVRNCFLPPSARWSYQGYLALIGDIQNETDHPNFLFPDVSITGNLPVLGLEKNFLFDKTYFPAPPPNADQEIYNTQDGYHPDFGNLNLAWQTEPESTPGPRGVYTTASWNSLTGYLAIDYDQIKDVYNPPPSDETNAYVYVCRQTGRDGAQIESSGAFRLHFPDPTPGDPYPQPQILAELTVYGHVYVDTTYSWITPGRPYEPTLGDGLAQLTVPVNDLHQASHTLVASTTTSEVYQYDSPPNWGSHPPEVMSKGTLEATWVF